MRASALLRGDAPASELHLAMLAHRFKAPLAVMRQCVGVVLEGCTGEIGPRARGMIEIVAQRADQMIQFVSDWLTLSRLEQGKELQEAKPVNVLEVIKTVVERVKQDPRAEKLTIRSEEANDPGSILADATALDELFGNLLDNAIRYTPPGGTVSVEVRGAPDEVSVVVRDTGPGISQEDLGHIFEPFYRGQAQKSVPGTGLGLPIAKRIAEGHGGRIEVETALGKGAAFRVVLPRKGAKKANGPPAAQKVGARDA
jgi:two-component system phosphate regulon sensor histidine kinase PhoR